MHNTYAGAFEDESIFVRKKKQDPIYIIMSYLGFKKIQIEDYNIEILNRKIKI